uniref:Uncharacterized protein n=1 Tax=Arundo donax TaxID=35708 RepID=A0A0A9A0H5_ARUDO
MRNKLEAASARGMPTEVIASYRPFK